jgi:hypothetical protein
MVGDLGILQSAARIESKDGCSYELRNTAGEQVMSSGDDLGRPSVAAASTYGSIFSSCSLQGNRGWIEEDERHGGRTRL